MRRVSSDILEDASYVMPPVRSGPSGLAWLRAHVPRFRDGADHDPLRRLAVDCIATIKDAPYAETPTLTLLRALGLPDESVSDIDLVARAYQPHAPQSDAADAAADRLVALCGGRTDAAAVAVSVLVQAHPAVAAGIELAKAGRDDPPVPLTWRRGPGEVDVEVDLVDAHFGRGPHACPGEALARRLIHDATR